MSFALFSKKPAANFIHQADQIRFRDLLLADEILKAQLFSLYHNTGTGL